MKTIGPHVTIQTTESKLVCIRCDYLKNHLIRSGRNPQWECTCLHPRAKEVAMKTPPVLRVWSDNLANGCWIGEQPDTPHWCPELKANKEGQ